MEIWNSVLLLLETEISTVSFDVWIKNIEPYCICDNKLVLITPSRQSLNVVLTNYKKSIESALSRVHASISEIEVILDEDKDKYTQTQNAEIINKNQPAPISTLNMFNPKYSFKGFVVGASNKFAHAAARAVCENPGANYNPLYIYGGVGVGKTHLMHAIGNQLKATHPSLRVLYVSSERFVNDLIASIRSGKDRTNTDFRDRYRNNVDVLMIDDIQFIADKTSTQEEFFHTFNDLYQNNKQIIISSDRIPKEINNLDDRIRSRFEWGMIADITPPDLEMRIAILQMKAMEEKFNVSHDVLTFIAERVTTNREMIGLLSKVVFFASLTNKPAATLDIAQEALRDYLDDRKEALNADKIIEETCKYFSVSKDDLTGKRKTKEIVEPRQICIYLMTELLTLPLETIGNILGNRDHTTIIHSRDKIADAVKTNNRIKVAVNDLTLMVNKK